MSAIGKVHILTISHKFCDSSQKKSLKKKKLVDEILSSSIKLKAAKKKGKSFKVNFLTNYSKRLIKD